ncbi:MAG: glycosyltransferase family 2 protein, partial [Polyangiales bacterium]
MTTPELSVVIFAFNEQSNIGPVLEELRTWLATHEPNSEVIFVDDGSSDGTAAAAAAVLAGSRHQIHSHVSNRGIGAALKTGVAAARGDWVTFLPADGQIAPDAIGQLRDAATQDGSDVVFSVYADRDDGLHRKVLSAGVRNLILLVHGVQMRSDGPYLFRRPLFDPD